MKTILFSLLFSTLFISFQPVLADSPLTSTDFHTAYRNEAIIQLAAESNGALSKDLMDYLIDPAKPIELKMAVINCLGWNFDGKNNAELFFAFMKGKRGYSSEKQFMKKATADELLCMAYLKALDNYFDVYKAIEYADKAVKKNPKSYTFNLITSLIKAQAAMDRDWCKTYTLVRDVEQKTSLTHDMKDEAITIIFDYMNLYKESCK